MTRLLLTGALAALCAAIPASAQAPTAGVETVLLLQLDGDATDVSDCAHRATAYGAPAWQPGQHGQALALDGRSGLAYTGAALQVGARSWTVEVWFKPGGAPPKRPVALIAGGPDEGRRYLLGFDRNGLIGQVFASDGRAASVRSKPVGGTFFDGGWRHAALVLDQARHGELRVYLDGANVSAKRAYQPIPLRTSTGRMKLVVGSLAPWYVLKPSKHTHNFTGLIDAVRVSAGIPAEFAVAADAEPRPEPVALGVAEFAAAAGPLALTPAATRIVVSLENGGLETVAARLLQRYLRKRTGAAKGFDIVFEDKIDADAAHPILAVGPTRWARAFLPGALDRDGFVLRRQGAVVVIAGGGDRGNLHGAVEFLNRVCGVRFYMPGEMWTSLPAPGPISIDALDATEEPYVKSCTVSGFHSAPLAAKTWAERNAMLRPRGGTHQHSFYQRLDPQRYAEDFPEIYPIIKGKRYIPASGRARLWQPCFSEPKLLDASVDSAVRYFKANPGAEYVSFSVEDGHQFCECARCAAGARPYSDVPGMTPAQVRRWPNRRDHSALYWQYLSALAARLATELPQHGVAGVRLVVGIAYSDVRHAPAFKLHPNVVTWWVFKISDLIIDKRFESGPDGRNRVDPWLAVSNHIGHHDWAHGSGFLIPRIYTGLTSRFFRTLKPHSLIYIHTEGYPNWGLDGPKLWVHSRIWWNPDVDVTGLWGQFCKDMFGPAAAPMRAYFAGLEELYASLNLAQERKLNRWYSQFGADEAQRQTMARCRRNLTEAEAAAATDLQKARLATFSKTFRLSERLFELDHADAITDEQAAEITDYVANELAPDPMTIYRRGARQEGVQYLREQMERVLKSLKNEKKKRNRAKAP